MLPELLKTVIRMNSKNCNAMKKIFTKLMLLAVAAAALVSCENKFDEQTVGGELTQTVTLLADKTAVRTELIEGVPYWSKGDQIGVYVQDSEGYKNYAFKNDSEESSLTTTFTGTTAVANTLFVYYPYTNFSTPVTEKGVKVEILANQEPTAASFDGRTDLMIAKPVTLDEEGKQLSDLEFARVAAIVKIVLKDKTGNLAGQHVSSLTMTAATNLVGRVYLDVVNQEINSEEGLYWGGAPSVNATYTEATQYEVNGENATYVVVYPQTLATGSKLSFEAVTEGYAISKEITLPSDIELLAGKVTTLNVSLAAENVVKEETGLALPFEDDFARFPIANNENAISTLGDNYSAFENIYNSKEIDGAIKFGTGSKAGSITTVALNLSEPFTVILAAKCYGSDKTTVNVTVGSVTKQVTLTSTLAYYAVEFDAASKKEAVTVAASGTSYQRFHFDDLQVVAGHDVVLPTLPPVLTVNVESITSISHEGENVTFEYEVANPVEGTSVVITDDAEWLTTADNNGIVTVTVAENTLEEERNATITVKYGDLTKTIAIQQNAKPAAGGEPTAQYVKVTTAQSDWSGTYLIVSGTSAATTMNGSWLKYQTVTVSNDIIASNTNTDAIAVTIDKVGEKYTIKLSDGKYLKTTDSNSALTSVAVADNNSYWTFTIESSAAKIVWGGNASRHLRLNGTSGFRTYINTTGTIATLYKLVGGSSEGGETPETPAPVLDITTTSPIAVGAEGDVATVAYTITNPVEGQSVTASADQSWVNDFDYTVAGEVSFAVEANTGAAREATVTLAYDGAESKTIKVSQAAGNTGGTGGDSGKTTYVLITNINDLTSGEYIMAAYANNKYIALPTNPTVSSGKIVGNEITVTNNEISETDADGYVWTFTKSGNYYTVSDGVKNLYHSNGGGSGTNLAYGTSTSYVWSITYDKAFVFAGVTNNSTVNSRGMLYQMGIVNKFGGYALSNKAATDYSQIYLFKKSN